MMMKTIENLNISWVQERRTKRKKRQTSSMNMYSMWYNGEVTIAGNDPLVQDAERAPRSSGSRQPAEACTGRHRGHFKVMLINICLQKWKRFKLIQPIRIWWRPLKLYGLLKDTAQTYRAASSLPQISQLAGILNQPPNERKASNWRTSSQLTSAHRPASQDFVRIKNRKNWWVDRAGSRIKHKATVNTPGGWSPGVNFWETVTDR